MRIIITSSLVTALLALTVSVHGQGNWKKISEELVFRNPPFRECHASTILEITPGTLMIACFAGSQEGNPDVNIWTTEQKGKSRWGKPTVMADGILSDSNRVPAWNPVLFRSGSGKTFLFYKLGPNPRHWWGMVRTSPDSGRTWTAPVRLPESILGPVKNKPVQLVDGTILSASSTETDDDRWNVHMEYSTDDGQSWELIPVDDRNPFKVIQPTILTHGDGKVQILCRSNQNRVVESWSEDNGRTWGSLEKTNLLNPNSGIDAVTLKNGKHLLVYNPTESGKEWFNGRAKLALAESADGKTWTDILLLENGTKEEFSYPAIIEGSDGKVHITYTFDRKNVKHVVVAE